MFSLLTLGRPVIYTQMQYFPGVVIATVVRLSPSRQAGCDMT